jgi:PAS domain S-box-containing protein
MVNTRYLDELTQDEHLQRLTLALDGAGVGVWDWDLRNDRVEFDARWCEMVGLDHASTPMLLETWSSRVHPDDIKRCEEDIAAHLAGETPRYENVHRMKHADGHWVFILDRGRVSGRDAAGRPIRFTGTHADVTEIEVAKRALLDRERELALLIDNLPTGAALLDGELRVLVSNRTWLDNLGLREVDDVRGTEIGSLLPTSECLDSFLTAVMAARGGGGPPTESLVTGRDGQDRWLRWHLRTWPRLERVEGAVLFCIENVTAQVESRRTIERERAARMANLALFAGGIAHELNSPLQVLLSEAESLTELLGRGEAFASTEPPIVELHSVVESIATTARRAGAIARALRVIARDTRRDPPSTVRVDEVVRDVLTLCTARVSSAGCTLTVGDIEGSLELWGRPADVLHALLSLVYRAIGAASERARWIRLEVDEGDDTIIFRVVDGGRAPAPAEGMTWSRHEDPLDALTEAHSSILTDAEQNQVIALGVAHEIAVRNGGILTRDPSAPFTTFEVHLPRRATGLDG